MKSPSEDNSAIGRRKIFEWKSEPDLLPTLILLISAGAFYTLLWNTAPYLTSDSPGYLSVAVDLLDGSLDQLSDRTLGYPLLLIITGSISSGSRLLFITQLTLHLISVLLLVLLLKQIKASRILIFLFVFLALLPPSVVITAYVGTETLAESLLIVGYVSLLFWIGKADSEKKIALLLVSGLKLGFSALVRPTYQLLFVIVSATMFLIPFLTRAQKRRWLQGSASILLCSTLIIGGYLIYNYLNFGFFGLTPLFGFNLSTRTVRVLERLPDDFGETRNVLIRYRNESLIEEDSSHTGVMYIWEAISELE